MVYLKSLFPPIPELPPLNIHTLLFERPPGNAIPKDFVIHIDGLTGETRTYGEYVERIRDCATALSAPVSQGGLDIRHDGPDKEIIAIFSPNCLVRFQFSSAPAKDSGLTFMLGLLCNGTCRIGFDSTVCAPSIEADHG